MESTPEIPNINRKTYDKNTSVTTSEELSAKYEVAPEPPTCCSTYNKNLET